MIGAPAAASTLDAALAVLMSSGAATGPDWHAAQSTMRRARRADPANALVALALGLACLRHGDPAEAATLYEEVCRQHDVAEAWLGLAAGAMRAKAVARAATAMQACLSRHAAGLAAMQMAPVVAAASGYPGWCAIDSNRRVHTDGPADLTLDGMAWRSRWSATGTRIPSGRTLTAVRKGRTLLGSPIDLVAIGALEGFVEVRDGGLSGWAWHPGDPARRPVLTITGATALALTLRDKLPGSTGMRPLARPWRIAVAAHRLPVGVLSVTGPDGRELLGSPIDPGLEQRCAAGVASGFQPVWADVVGTQCTKAPDCGPVDVVVPVYGGRAQALACLDSVLASLPTDSRLHVVDDCSPDVELVAALQDLAVRGLILLHRQAQNRGFPAAANAGLRACNGRDVVLLNSDTLVPPGWLQTITAGARSAPGIGSASPFSNDATILSYPAVDGGNPMPDLAGAASTAALARRANGDGIVDIPVSVGFCMFIRRACLDDVGLFREDVFAQGYGEENDFCLRARHRGWRHVAVTGAFVAHAGGASFGAARRHLQARNATVLARLHPGYDTVVAQWIAEDPLGPARLRMDALRWAQGRRRASVVLVTHSGGGGVDRVIASRTAEIEAVGERAVVLRPDGAYTVVGDGGTPNLRYRLSSVATLARLLRQERPRLVEYHHMLGHAPALLGLAKALHIPYEVYVHDYSWFCPRIALVPEHGYCGEPDLAGCEACVADHGSLLTEDTTVTALVARSAEVLGDAVRVVAPSRDVAARLQRHFPQIVPRVQAWEPDDAISPPAVPSKVRRVCIVGAIGVEKGYEILLACVRDSVRRRLPLTFTLVGHSSDDERLLTAGPIEITGRYQPEEVEALIREQRADIAFLPSVCPETWCFTLGHAWTAGLRAAVFDLGTPAGRVRRTGWGWVLPLGLPPAGINDWLVNYGLTQRSTSRLPAGTLQSRASPSQSNAAM